MLTILMNEKVSMDQQTDSHLPPCIYKRVLPSAWMAFNTVVLSQALLKSGNAKRGYDVLY